jgi:hypothetical protein
MREERPQQAALAAHPQGIAAATATARHMLEATHPV